MEEARRQIIPMWSQVRSGEPGEELGCRESPAAGGRAGTKTGRWEEACEQGRSEPLLADVAVLVGAQGLIWYLSI